MSDDMIFMWIWLLMSWLVVMFLTFENNFLRKKTLEHLDREERRLISEMLKQEKEGGK